MSDKEKKIIENIKRALPEMDDMEKERLLSFGEGMAFMAEQRAAAKAEPGKEQ